MDNEWRFLYSERRQQPVMKPTDAEISELTGPIALFSGAMVLVALPKQPKMIPALLESIHQPSDDLAKTASGEYVTWRGTWPRITAFFLSKRTDAAMEKARLKADAGLPADLNPFEYLRYTHLPHYVDVERAVMLADGNIRNLENCPYYMIVRSFDAA